MLYSRTQHNGNLARIVNGSDMTGAAWTIQGISSRAPTRLTDDNSNGAHRIYAVTTGTVLGRYTVMTVAVGGGSTNKHARIDLGNAHVVVNTSDGSLSYVAGCSVTPSVLLNGQWCVNLQCVLSGDRVLKIYMAPDTTGAVSYQGNSSGILEVTGLWLAQWR